MLATCVSLMATWEALCSTMATGLVSGGPVSLIYGAIVAAIGSTCSALSLAELASAYPTAGGQYHFVAHLSGQSASKVTSYFAGFVTTFGWITVTGSAPFLAGTMIQGLLVLNYPETYIYERWHGTLIYWAVLVVAVVVCIFCSHILPLVEKISMTLHIALFFVILIVMCALSPTKHSASYVFTTFENNSGWASDGAAWCIGMLSSCYVLIGYDGATHLSEEMRNPEIGIPYAMVGSVVLNSFLGFCFLIALLFCMGDITAALQTTTGFPIIEIFYNITRSHTGASAMSASVILMASLATIPLLASAARVMWAFARDQGISSLDSIAELYQLTPPGLPFSTTLSKVEKKRGIPTVAILVTLIILMLLGLINIGSTTAFNAILSLAVVGLQISYLVPILLLIWRRFKTPESLAWGPFRLGKAGLFVNVIATMYLVFTSVFSLFPPYQPVTPQNMNYASLVLGATLIFGLVYWLLFARKTYAGALNEMEGVAANATEVAKG
ncbi:Choline transport protein [Fusarium oxysporum f. sp. rapae]|uniref:Choline transport protein n=1 Tax=Fusarium oxysporum f. sp. rapae TaxID=485398 RepID=A0A8J5P3I2_FUSOX|nr:Choline transport protein [Fusarium oxysporum f. sp. rapae]